MSLRGSAPFLSRSIAIWFNFNELWLSLRREVASTELHQNLGLSYLEVLAAEDYLPIFRTLAGGSIDLGGVVR